MKKPHEIDTKCVSCSFKGGIEVKKGEKIYEMSCTECGKKTLRKRRKPRRVKGHEQLDSNK